MDIDTMINTYSTTETDAATGILGKKCRRKKWDTRDDPELDL